ncbi:MAG: hypothetical protein B6D76_09385 [gamma proteobacterium symbiont of Stewartia floridana]|nr:MAG: hypothetical protein B6D76_09385 [gamma proteobacterium symbiont of Stewartia floridana]RLW59581.1 MAG: hypothetical protein B6D75_08795 [gamma proteobacterium symbiont of Stewartia floridana]
MLRIQNHLDFVNSQIDYQNNQIKRLTKSVVPANPITARLSVSQSNVRRKIKTHERILSQLTELFEFLENSCGSANENSEKSKTVSASYHLTPDDLEGLPPELLKELNISESDELELQIMRALRNAGGALTVDKILIQLYRDTGGIHERKALAAKLYRMTQKNLLQSVPDRRGLYELVELNDGDEFELESENPPEGG